MGVVTFSIKTAASTLLRISLVFLCLTYVVWDIDLDAFLTNVRAFSFKACLAMLLLVGVGVLVMGVRLRFLSENRLTVGQAAKATLLAGAVNNLLPVRLGEIIKVLYIRFHGAIPVGEGLGIVFWERFYDLNVLAGFAVVAALTSGTMELFYPLLAGIVLVWAVLMFLWWKPNVCWRLVKVLPEGRLRQLGGEIMDALGARKHGGFHIVLAMWSLLIWTSWFFLIWLAMDAFGAGFTVRMAFVTLVAGTVGLTLPSSPGGVGVYEAAVVAVLSLYGVGKEEALAVAVVLHLVQLLPMTFGGLCVAAGTRFNVREALRKASIGR